MPKSTPKSTQLTPEQQIVNFLKQTPLEELTDAAGYGAMIGHAEIMVNTYQIDLEQLGPLTLSVQQQFNEDENEKLTKRMVILFEFHKKQQNLAATPSPSTSVPTAEVIPLTADVAQPPATPPATPVPASAPTKPIELVEPPQTPTSPEVTDANETDESFTKLLEDIYVLGPQEALEEIIRKMQEMNKQIQAQQAEITRLKATRSLAAPPAELPDMPFQNSLMDGLFNGHPELLAQMQSTPARNANEEPATPNQKRSMYYNAMIIEAGERPKGMAKNLNNWLIQHPEYHQFVESLSIEAISPLVGATQAISKELAKPF